MTGPKDSAEVIKFMALFQRLRDWIDDDPEGLTDLAATDESVKKLCEEVRWAAEFLSMNERRRRNIFEAPVDLKFIAAWRCYEDRYSHVLLRIWFSDIFPELENGEISKHSSADIQWVCADNEACDQAAAIELALVFAEEQITDEGRGFPESFLHDIEESISAWARLKSETGFDLRGIFRRRELIPFVLVPSHVAAQHGSAEKLSLFTHLQQAHDAFVFGVPFAAIALMRSILETTLKKHYHADGKDLDERIDNCRGLPPSAQKQSLHRLRHLANDVLHFNNKQVRLPRDMEKELLSLLYVLRALIEGAPTRHSIGAP